MIHLAILVILSLPAYAVGRRLLSAEAKRYLPAIAVQAAELLWIGAAALIAGAGPLALIDPFVLLLGVTWLVLQPELRAVLFLTAFQVVMLGLNGRDLLATDFDVLGHQALAVHIAWRAAAIGLAWKGYFTSPSTPASAC